MNIETLEWDHYLCEKVFKIPVSILPKMQSSASQFGLIKSGSLQGIPVTGVIGDQHSALVGHQCLSPGQIKSTYGTGCFILQNLGSLSVKKVLSGVSAEARKSLILTVAYKIDGKPAVYALEGSIAVVGASMVWLRDNMGLINDFNEIQSLTNLFCTRFSRSICTLLGSQCKWFVHWSLSIYSKISLAPSDVGKCRFPNDRYMYFSSNETSVFRIKG
ncbi:glycerol kinase-like [Panonychus citri]|uniref:glycerol kinase-like n=1 Tax=Panonychus citri TaxID=50023 RepID=UPI00230707E1|nr:glycerol kinase-like [Panonychus citri]